MIGILVQTCSTSKINGIKNNTSLDLDSYYFFRRVTENKRLFMVLNDFKNGVMRKIL